MGGGGGSKSTSKTSYQPPKYITPMFYEGANEAQNAFQAANKNLKPFGGDFRAPAQPSETEGYNRTIDWAHANSDFGKNISRYGNDLISGKYLDLNNNQYAQDYLRLGLEDPTKRAISNTILPGIHSNAIAEGAYGGAQNALNAGRVSADAYKTGYSDPASSFLAQLYGQERGYMNQAPGIIKSGAEAENIPSQLLVSGGEGLKALEQSKLDNDLAKYNEQIQARFRAIIPYADLLAKLAGNYGNTYSTQPGSSPLAGGISGGLGGAASGAIAGSMIAPGIGTALGAVGGGLLGAFGGSRG